MLNPTSLSADMKTISRDPVLILFMLLPTLIIGVFKLIILYAMPLVHEITGFDSDPYIGYFISFLIMMTPVMLGTVAAFLMLDEKDNKIYELMSITPMGYSGYIANRLLIPFLGSLFYSIIGYYVMNVFHLNILLVLFVSILTGIDSILVALLLFKFAEDKVKGLTYSKALGAFAVLALADLFKVYWLNIIALFNPLYWIVRLITTPFEISTIFAACVVHLFYLAILVKIPHTK